MIEIGKLLPDGGNKEQNDWKGQMGIFRGDRSVLCLVWGDMCIRLSKLSEINTCLCILFM